MIDMSKMGRDFMPRRRPEEGFAPQGGGGVQIDQPFGVQPTAPPGGTPQWQGGGQPQPQVSIGQPQPFAPVTGTTGPLQQGMPPGMQPPAGGITGTAGPLQQGLPPGMTMEQLQGAMGAQQPGGQPQAGAPGAGAFPYPEQWGQAGDIYGKLAGGMPGMPDPGAMWGGYEQQAGDLSRELAEQAGMGMGTRYGSALQRNIADVGMRAGERFGGEMERMRMGDVAGQRQAMLGAAGGLSGLGGAQAMLPGQLAGQAMGLGGQYQGMQQQEYDRQLQEFMRTQPGYNPLLPYMQQGSRVQYGPQSYQPGFASNMMDIGGMMGMYGMMGGG